MKQLIPLFSILFLWLAVVGLTVWLMYRAKYKRTTKPPMDLALARQPGESLRDKFEKLLEKWMWGLLIGSFLAFLLLVGPLMLGSAMEWKQPDLLTVIGILLFMAMLILTIKWGLRQGRQLHKYKLGQAGERAVAEALQHLSVQGYHIFHDVQITTNGKTTENLDHLAVGPHGVILIETKTRGIDKNDRQRDGTVTFDGERLIWPNWGNDFKTVKQVNRGAVWVANWLKDTCGLETTVQQIIAIPGWHVTPGNFYNPRVLPAAGVAAFIQNRYGDKPPVLKPHEIRKVVTKLGELNRTADW